MDNILTERQLFVLERALAYFLSNLDEYNDCMMELVSFITEKEVEEVIRKLGK